MKNTIIVVKKKRSFLKIIIKIMSVIAILAAACVVAYKYLENKYKSKILGRIDLDGDGEFDAIMIDTTGNGEVDTIIINTDDCEDSDEE